VDHVTREATEFMKGMTGQETSENWKTPLNGPLSFPKKGRSGVEDFSFLIPSPAVRSGARTLKEREKDYIQEVLEENDWNVTRSAAVLGINRVTLHKMIKRYNLQRVQ